MEKQSEYKAVLTDNINYNGTVLESTIAMEELAELIQAISKVKRYGCVGKHKDNLIEEIADTQIVIAEVMMMFGVTDDDVKGVMNAKIRRLIERMSAK